MFWTILIPPESIDVSPGAGHARMCVSDLVVGDFGTNLNSFLRGLSVPATVAFDIMWTGVGKPQKVEDDVNRFRGTFVDSAATIEWSATRTDFEFVSDPAETSFSTFAVVGHERNGDFF